MLPDHLVACFRILGFPVCGHSSTLSPDPLFYELCAHCHFNIAIRWAFTDAHLIYHNYCHFNNCFHFTAYKEYDICSGRRAKKSFSIREYLVMGATFLMYIVCRTIPLLCYLCLGVGYILCQSLCCFVFCSWLLVYSIPCLWRNKDCCNLWVGYFFLTHTVFTFTIC